MKIISQSGDKNFAEVFVAKARDDSDSLIEFVDARDPRFPKSEKWVIIVSTQIGCPVKCTMCDSGYDFKGNLTEDEIYWQIDQVYNRNSFSNHPKLKIQFARMGEPSLNPYVLNVISGLGKKYKASIIPCIATVAPKSASAWFRELAAIKDNIYPNGMFQLQFSVNSTNESVRDQLMPIHKWKLEEISRFGESFFKSRDRKIVLNFALAKEVPFESCVVEKIFNPEKFIIKITPVNPTYSSKENGVDSVLTVENQTAADEIAKELGEKGFETIISIGAAEEIAIGSNCGQSVRTIRTNG